MSTTAEFQDLEQFEQALADIRSDQNGVERKAWLLVGHVGDSANSVHVIDADNTNGANICDFVSRLEDDQVMYGLLRLTSTFDMSTTVKFVYVHWIGENVPFAKKGRYGVVHGSIQERFNPYHINVETGNPEELSETAILQMLDESSGTKNRVMNAADARNRQERGFRAGETKRNIKDTSTNVKQPVLNEIPTSEDFAETVQDVRNDGSSTRWILVGYEDGDIKKPLTVVGKGEGDIEELKEKVDYESVYYALYRVTDVVDDIPTVKFVYICWIGNSVKAMTKAKVSTHRGKLEMMFSPFHASISTSDDLELNEADILDKVASSSGSKSFVK